MGSWKQVCRADASPGPAAGVDTWQPCTLEGFAAMDHDSSSSLDSFISAQKNGILHSGFCRFMLGCVCGNCLNPLQFVVWWSVLKEPGLQGLGEIRKQGKGYRWENECWQLSEFQWSVLAGTSWTAVNFSIWKTQISSTLVQLKKMFIFEIRDEQMEESDFFSANPEPYCSRKCKVIESVVMIQSRKVTG